MALAQINPAVGDIAGNARRIAEQTSAARDGGAGLVVFPELTLSGYPPEDLLLKTSFLDAGADALGDLAAQTHGIVALVGFPERAEDVYNAAAVLADGEVVAVYRKMYLPNYGVFDEQRYFQSGAEAAIFELNGIPIGISICEDIWEPGPPAMTEALGGAQVIVNLSASPTAPATASAASACWCSGRSTTWRRSSSSTRSAPRTSSSSTATASRSTRTGLCSRAARNSRSRSASARSTRARWWRRGCVTLGTAPTCAASGAPQRSPSLPVFTLASVSVEFGGRRRRGEAAPTLELEAEVYAALRIGLHDYVEKNGFERVVVALSGGIDSALVALIAADALGPERVSCVSMPSPYSSEGTRADARAIAENLGVDFREISIEAAMRAYDEMLADSFAGPSRTSPRRTCRRASAGTW